jgi:hypothetical protein
VVVLAAYTKSIALGVSSRQQGTASLGAQRGIFSNGIVAGAGYDAITEGPRRCARRDDMICL